MARPSRPVSRERPAPAQKNKSVGKMPIPHLREARRPPYVERPRCEGDGRRCWLRWLSFLLWWQALPGF